MARVEKTVFLSYRRANAPWALSIYQNLTANGFDVFFDYKGIASGDFESVILENIRDRAHFIVALTPSALERCGDPEDWLRREIEEAIECRRNIVPLFLDGFDFGASSVASQLTGRLAELKNYNGLTVPFEYFDEAMEKLRDKFLNVPVDTILHPASSSAQEAAKEQQIAAGSISIVIEKPKTGSETIAPFVQQIQQPETKVAEEPTPSLPKKITNSIGMEFVLIPPGTFMMGSHLSPKQVVENFGGEKNWHEHELPLHEVRISQLFYLQTTEVTQGQWVKVMRDNPSRFNQCGDDCPVENVSWEDTQRFINKLNQLEKTDVYRLPTEAEWEYACRAGTVTEFSFGNSTSRIGEYAWHSINSDGKTQRVARKKCNAWGLYDMHGNIWEWCQDWYSENYYKISPKENPEGAITGAERIVRGGSWWNVPGGLRTASRNYIAPDRRDYRVGFRLCRSIALGS